MGTYTLNISPVSGVYQHTVIKTICRSRPELNMVTAAEPSSIQRGMGAGHHLELTLRGWVIGLSIFDNAVSPLLQRQGLGFSLIP